MKYDMFIYVSPNHDHTTVSLIRNDSNVVQTGSQMDLQSSRLITTATSPQRDSPCETSSELTGVGREKSKDVNVHVRNQI